MKKLDYNYKILKDNRIFWVCQTNFLFTSAFMKNDK